jgi:hypothetical protein
VDAGRSGRALEDILQIVIVIEIKARE